MHRISHNLDLGGPGLRFIESLVLLECKEMLKTNIANFFLKKQNQFSCCFFSNLIGF